MQILTELLAHTIADDMADILPKYDFSTAADGINNEMADMLEEIYDVLCCDMLSDFEAIEQITCIYEKHGLSSGVIHDFG